jgi:hypothetical protein
MALQAASRPCSGPRSALHLDTLYSCTDKSGLRSKGWTTPRRKPLRGRWTRLLSRHQVLLPTFSLDGEAVSFCLVPARGCRTTRTCGPANIYIWHSPKSAQTGHRYVDIDIIASITRPSVHLFCMFMRSKSLHLPKEGTIPVTGSNISISRRGKCIHPFFSPLPPSHSYPPLIREPTPSPPTIIERRQERPKKTPSLCVPRINQRKRLIPLEEKKTPSSYVLIRRKRKEKTDLQGSPRK